MSLGGSEGAQDEEAGNDRAALPELTTIPSTSGSSKVYTYHCSVCVLFIS